ncbi:MAG: TetR/AcrR family transcriptional regulator C-terminal domain-containing protein [Solirubrobacteraceae bacterium]
MEQPHPVKQTRSAAPGLSWHVGSKDDLKELMFDAAVGEIDLPAPTGDWREDLRAIARVSHRVFRRHPWLVLLGIQPGLGPNTRRYGDFGMSLLGEHGIGRTERTEVMALLNNYVMGFAHPADGLEPPMAAHRP